MFPLLEWFQNKFVNISGITQATNILIVLIAGRYSSPHKNKTTSDVLINTNKISGIIKTNDISNDFFNKL